MGIYDRDYYRRSTSSLFDSFARTGRVCKWLIIINAVVFVVQLFTLAAPTEQDPFGIGPFTNFLLLDTQKILHGQVWRLLTCAFLHSPGTLFHIIFNMWFLWMFGRDMEDIYGSKEFLTFYLTAAVGSSLAFTAYGVSVNLAENMPGGTMRALGASGAVTATMLLFACHYPRRTILLFFLIPIPVWLFVGFQVLQDSFIFASGIRTGTAVTAHLGGALFGFLYYRFGWRLSPFFTRFRLPSFKRRKGPRLRVYREEEVYREPVAVGPPKSAVDEQLEAKIDAILQKIQTSGQDSLTPSERELLMRASEVYKKKRSSDD